MEFFDQQREASAIKSEIVSKYFSAWARIIGARSNKIGYIDLFSGPGCYDDGTESTPMIILKKALSLPGIADKFVAIFNDASETNTNILKSCINDIPGIEAISPRISISTKPVDRAIADEINKISLIPVFSFIDPFGYAGVSKDLITALTKDNCCDCIFFLNYSRINAGITNPRVPHHIEAIFGMDIDNIRNAVCGLSPSEREATILELLSQSFQNINGRPAFVLPFRFRRPPGSRGSATSHYLIFLTKHILGYSVMKDIMHNAGGVDSDGIGNFEFVPVTNSQLSLLFGYTLNLEELKNSICRTFHGKTLSVKNIYWNHTYGTRFVMSDYKKALLELESEGKILCNPSNRMMRKGVKTMADHVNITFI